MIELLETYGILHIGISLFYFDLDDLPIIESRRWYVDKDGYLTSSYYYLGQLRIVRFHRIVAHAKPGQWVDHRDKNRANNRKQNLRCCSYSENGEMEGKIVSEFIEADQAQANANAYYKFLFQRKDEN